jgi:hypothetical protein
MKTRRKHLIGVCAAAAIGAAANAGSLYNGLAAYYTFDEAQPANHIPNATITGLTLSGSGEQSGTLNGDYGHSGFGGYLDLAGGWARIEGSEDLAFENGNDFTVAVWMRAESSQTGDPVFFGNGNWNAGKQPGVILSMYYNAVHTDGIACNYANPGIETGRIRVNSYPAPLATWVFCAVSHTADGKFRFWRSSEKGALTLVAENDAADLALVYANPEERRPFYLGQDGTGAYPLPFTGKLDEFAFWTRGLDPADINAIYQNGRKGRPLQSLLMPGMAMGDETAGNVTLTFEGEHSGNWGLYIGYGAADGGADKFAWDNFEQVATIASTDTSYTYALPAEFAADGLYYRFFFAKDMTYQEVEYVQNTHPTSEASYFDSGIVPARYTTVFTDVEIDGGETYGNIFGCCDGANYYYYHLGFFWNEKLWYTEISKSSATPSLTTKFGSADVGDRTSFEFSPPGVYWWNSVTEGAADWRATAANPAALAYSDVPMYVFRCRKIDGSFYDKSFVGKMYALCVSENGSLSRDYVPVKNGTTAGFYDLVERRFVASASAYPFAAGPATSGRLCVQTATAKAKPAGAPVSAYWVGGATSRLDSPASWHCVDETGREVVAIPQSFTDITVPYSSGMFSVPEDSGFECRSVSLASGVSLEYDCDWRGMDFSKVTAAGPLDLAGYSFAILANENPGDALAYTDTEGGGELHIEVPDGKTVINTKIALSGAATLVKDGAGTLVANKQNQSNTGGVRVDGGVLVTTAYVNAGVLGATGARVEIGPYGTLRVENGYAGLENHDLVLAGGTLHMKNSELLPGRSVIGSLSQTADSRIRLESTQSNDGYCDTEAANGTVWNLGGFELTVEFLTDKSDFMLGRGKSVKPVFRNGTIVLQNDVGYWHDEGIDASDGVTYVYGMKYVRQQNTASVWNLVNNIPEDANVGNGGPLCIYGTYTPNSEVAMRLKMMNGSTIDLEECTNAWPVALGGEGELARVLDYEENATVRIWLGERHLGSENRKIVSWDSRPVGIHFTDKAKKWTLSAKADGLYAQKGFSFVVK